MSGRTLRFDRMRGTELAGETYRSRHLFIVSPTSLYPLPLVTSSSYRPQMVLTKLRLPSAFCDSRKSQPVACEPISPVVSP